MPSYFVETYRAWDSSRFEWPKRSVRREAMEDIARLDCRSNERRGACNASEARAGTRLRGMLVAVVAVLLGGGETTAQAGPPEDAVLDWNL